MPIRKIIYVVFFIFLFNYGTQAREFNDFGIWTQFNLNKNLKNNFTLNGQLQSRFSENSMELSRISASFGITYKLSKSFRFAVGYMYTRRSEVPGELLSNRNRLFFDVIYKKNMKRSVLQYRCRFQSQQTDIYTSENGSYSDYALRNRIAYKYELNLYLSPFVSQEFFMPLNTSIPFEINRFRSIAGIQYHINKMSDLELYFLYQRERDNTPTANFYTLGIGYKLIL